MKRYILLIGIVIIPAAFLISMEEDPYFSKNKPTPQVTTATTSSEKEDEETPEHVTPQTSASAPVTPMTRRRKSSSPKNLKKSSPSDSRSPVQEKNKKDLVAKWENMKELQKNPFPLQSLEITPENKLWIDIKSQLYNESKIPHSPIKISYGSDTYGNEVFIFTESIHDGSTIEYRIIPNGPRTNLEMSLFLKGEKEPVMMLQLGQKLGEKYDVEIFNYHISTSIYYKTGLQRDLMDTLKKRLKRLGLKTLAITFNLQWRDIFLTQLHFEELSFDGTNANVFAIFDLSKFPG